MGAQHCPLGLHALWGLRAAGVVGGRLLGGWPATVVWGAWCQALSPPRPPVLWSGRPGLQPARAHAVGPVLGPHTRTDRTRDTRAAEPRLPAPEDGWPGEGQRLTPSERWQATPPGDGPPPPPRHAAPAGPAGQVESVAPPHPHTRAHTTWVAEPNSPPSWRAVGGGTAPDLRRPSQWWKASPLGTPFRHPHSEQRRPARAHAVGPVLGPHARTDRSRDTRVAEPCHFLMFLTASTCSGADVPLRKPSRNLQTIVVAVKWTQVR